MSPALDADQARALALSAPVARLATVNPALGVDIVPVTFAVLERGEDEAAVDRVVTAVDHKPKSTTRLRRLRNIAEHPEVTVLVDHYENDWDRLWWARIRGRAEVVADGELFDRAVAALADRYEQYRATAPVGPAIVITVEEWTGWSAADSIL